MPIKLKICIEFIYLLLHLWLKVESGVVSDNRGQNKVTMAAASVVVSTSVSVSLSFKYGYRSSLSALSNSNSISKTNLKQSSLCFFNLPRSNSKSLIFYRKFVARTSIREGESESEKELGFVGEDSAAFELGKQKISSWIYFSAILGVVLYGLNVAWIDNSTGFGKPFVDAVSTLSDSHEVVLIF